MEGTTKLNGKTYKYKYRLFNSSGEVNISDSSVNALMISEDFVSPFTEGNITISNPFNSIEKEYVFKGDGSDYIDLKLIDEETDKGFNGTYSILGESNYTDDSTPAKNRKTFYFVDSDESLLLHEFPYGSSYCGRTGLILETILKEIGLKADNFEPGDSSFTNFDPYIPSVNHRYIDAIYYLLRHYYKVTDKNLPSKGFLRKRRENGTYTLDLLGKIFETNEKLTKEVFHSGDIINTRDLQPNINNPVTPSDAKYALFQNNITSVSFDTVSVDISNEYLMNSRVVTYDPIYGRHRSTQVKIQDVEKEWAKHYVDVFKSLGGAVKPHFNKEGPGNKINSQWKTYRLPFSHEQNVKLVWANMVGDLLFRNNQINIVTNGNIEREPGFFFDIIKLRDDDYLADSKLLGRWFTARIDHYKLGATYRNSINAVKTYVGPQYPVTSSR